MEPRVISFSDSAGNDLFHKKFHHIPLVFTAKYFVLFKKMQLQRSQPYNPLCYKTVSCVYKHAIVIAKKSIFYSVVNVP